MPFNHVNSVETWQYLFQIGFIFEAVQKSSEYSLKKKSSYLLYLLSYNNSKDDIGMFVLKVRNNKACKKKKMRKGNMAYQ